MNGTEKVLAFLDRAQVFYLATEDGDQPKCRPIGFKMEHNGKIYFGVGTFKAVYHQMEANPKVEICACAGDKFLRYYGKAVFDSDPAVAELALDAMPMLRDIYNDKTGNKLGMFYLTDATAEFRNMMAVEESISL